MASSSLLSPNQSQFLQGVAGQTKLDPNVLGAWLRNEEPKIQQNTDPAGHGRYNFLNVGITDSRPYGASSPFWNSNPRAAGVATGKWLLGQLSIPGFGKSAASIQRLRSAAGLTPEQQIRAIQQSGWASGGETAMPGLYRQITGQGGVAPANPFAAQPAKPASVAGSAPVRAPAAPAAPDYTYLASGITAAQNASQGALAQLAGISGTAAPIVQPLDLSQLMPIPTTPQTPTDRIVPLRGDAAGASKGLDTAGKKAVALAKKYLGTPYLYGGANPKTGFDCSGLLQYVWAKNGVQIPHNAQAQYDTMQHVTAKQLQPGDAVFFRDQSGIHHVGMYVGGPNRQFIQAPHTGDHVKISSLNESYYASQFAGGGRP